ncbi:MULTISPECIES: conjugal transfer protein TrbH [unclassified Mesorhizobium]|uniref:conjugal transfer protein TrbH n=1 Tax=unclassified Mesorhizobium TaxID=325217 RepID=UPI001126C374|nr:MULTISPECIES: conjugal transfer protein TrbH [unclassified Mesorhizobium]MBZ9898303.1 conjugal transfer protein TrbH [Mesorhizobium sp. BR1-1-6]TPM57765.1 conjugal transfer protein TrbH [Mesorhizobium sp. B2-2-4]TPM65873.1 conjugal transfer protein TrbH [Mesorhizobium sp. B2-2-1]TPN30500.1 conjugal transfer protein TrbH [Mesorhizobium sp. B1-1-6]TPN72199.1 conjugal transfer protein TrbH [Mesorhizobium sp. B1-1-3]
MASFRSLAPLARITAVSVMCACATACQTPGEGDLTASVDKAELSSTAANAIAGDMVSKLADVVGPGTGTIVLKSDGSPFGEAMKLSLKSSGYAVAMADQKTHGSKLIHLAYVVDSFEGSVLARLSTSTIDLGRAYAVTKSGATPSSPLSIMRRG